MSACPIAHNLHFAAAAVIAFGIVLQWVVNGAGANRYISLKAVKTLGVYNRGGMHHEYIQAVRQERLHSLEFKDGTVLKNRSQMPSFFLCEDGDTHVSTAHDDSNEKIAANLIPIPIPVNQLHILQAIKVAINFADNIGTLNILEHHNDHDVLVARKKGILHHLKPVAEVLGKRRAAEEIKCYLTESSARKSSKASSYHKIISALDKSGLCVTGLMVETADNDVDTEHISLGAAVLICKKEKRGSWVLTAMNCDEIISNELGNFEDAKFVRCHLDEMLGIHIATSTPIVISSSLFLRKSVSGLLKREAVEGAKNDVEIKIHAPYFDINDIKFKRWHQTLYYTRVKRPKGVKKVYEIENADDFLNMTIGEKRYSMRASGIFDLPRPREGPAAVDAMIVPLLQKKVLHKVTRQLNWTKSEFLRAKILRRQIDTDAVEGDVGPQQSCCFFVIDRNRSHHNHLKSNSMSTNRE